MQVTHAGLPGKSLILCTARSDQGTAPNISQPEAAPTDSVGSDDNQQSTDWPPLSIKLLFLFPSLV